MTNTTKPTQTSITITDACTQLNLDESQFRALIKPFYKNWETVKRIKFSIFNNICQELLTYDPDTETDETEEGTNGALIPSNSGTLSDVDYDQLSPTQQLQYQIQTNIEQSLLDMNELMKMLAQAAAMENLKDFQQIYDHTLNSGLNQINYDWTVKALTVMDNLQNSSNDTYITSAQKLEATARGRIKKLQDKLQGTIDF